MKKIVLLFSLPFTLALTLGGCASSAKLNGPMLEKYPACYNKNVKLSNKCIEMNEAGNKTTALELENAAYPGQYD